MRYERAEPFSNGTEYEIFRHNYCENGCIHHIDREDGFPELLENGGCPIEDGMGKNSICGIIVNFYAKEEGESDENTVR